MIYPILCSPIYKEVIWGGNRLRELFERNIPSDKTGESWDISCRRNEMSVIENGPDAGTTLADWLEADRLGTLGTAEAKEFPLLVKIIDACDDLSVQVHPGGIGGKSEMWYVLQAPDDGTLVVGLREGVTRDDLRRACEAGDAESCLNRLPVKRGDMIDIPAGLVHALTHGAIVAEIQQNSDITYRLFDYNRIGPDGKPRELHVEASLDAADFKNKLPREIVRGNVIENEFFRVEKTVIGKSVKLETDARRFTLITCVEGKCSIVWRGGEVELPLSRTAFVPAALGEYELRGGGTVLIGGTSYD